MLALAKDAEETSSFLLSKGIQLATDGAKPQVVRSVLEFYILSGDFSGKDLLERCIILEGVLAIQDGLHPKLLKELLLSFFGEKDYDTFRDELTKTGKNDLGEYLQEIKESEAGSLTGFKLSNIVLKMDDAKNY
jgi:flagellar motor component MotA